MFGVIDRFEGEKAVIEMDNGDIINIERIELPKEAMEGDVLKIDISITIDKNETKKRKSNIDELTKDMWT